MSLNLRRDTDADGDDAWAPRRDQVADCIRVHRPDCLALQEALPRQLAYLRESLPAYEFHAVGRQPDGSGERVPVGWRRERFEPLATDAFWLSPTPAEPGSEFADASHPRVTTTATLRDRKTGRRVRLVSAHFDHEGAEARARSAAVLADWLGGDGVGEDGRADDEVGGDGRADDKAAADGRAGDAIGDGDGAADPATLLLGDFNCEPDSVPYRRLAEVLTPARAAATRTYGPSATFHEFDGEPTEAIDHAFVAGLDVETFAVLTDHDDRGYPSDHFPVVVDLVHTSR